MIVTVQIYYNWNDLYHWKRSPVNMIDAVSRLMSLYIHCCQKYENFKSIHCHPSDKSLWWSLRSRFIIFVAISHHGNGGWSRWRMLWVDWCKFWIDHFSKKSENFRFMKEWKLISPSQFCLIWSSQAHALLARDVHQIRVMSRESSILHEECLGHMECGPHGLGQVASGLGKWVLRIWNVHAFLESKIEMNNWD